MKGKSPIVLALMIVLGITPLSFSQVLYNVIDLGDPRDPAWSFAYAINNSGQVVGTSDAIAASRHAFLWKNGEMTDLGTLSGGFSTAYGINNVGEVVGKSGSATIGWHPFIWDSISGIRPLFGGSGYGSAHAINDAGVVAGASYSGIASGSLACIWNTENGVTMTYLGTLGGLFSSAYSINNNGQVVGKADLADTGGGDSTHAFIWSRTTGMIDLGTLGNFFDFSQAEAINDSGQVVGWSDDFGTGKHAFLWTSADGMVGLGTLGGQNSAANAINNLGQVVGWAHTADSTHAFLWDATGGMVDLNELIAEGSGFSYLREAWGINEYGHIVGEGYTVDGYRHTFLLIPEPSAVLVFGLGGLWLRRRRK